MNMQLEDLAKMMYLQNHCNSITNGRCIRSLLYAIGKTLAKIN
jgi:hypothetical protein